MPTVIIGKRRLYDAIGVNSDASSEILHKVEFTNGKAVTLYMGPNPPQGIVSVEGTQYGIIGGKVSPFHTDFKYEAPCFLEISISRQLNISSNQMDLLKKEDKGTRDELLAEKKEDRESTEYLFDAISGFLALQVHRQLVLKPLVESSFLNSDFKNFSSFFGPTMEMLESIKTNSNTAPHILKLLEWMANASEDDLRKGGGILHWLLKAWRERDYVTKFMYLFIPLEAVLSTTDSVITDSKMELEDIESLIKRSEVPNKKNLLQFIERTKTKFGPTLNARFEAFACQASIPGWELDVKAFKKFNRMRNLLLHAGKKNVQSHINFEENTRSLEDLVERYISLALLKSDNVYSSRWRPVRENSI